MKKRPTFIRNWRELEQPRPLSQGSEETVHFADFALATGLSRLKILHLRLPPGARSNVPGAYRDEEEFFFVLKGAPDLWLDGHVYPLNEGDGIAFNDRTGIAHTLINNTDSDVHLFVFGEATRAGSQFFAPLERDAQSNAFLKNLGKLWENPPKRELGPHDALSDHARGGAPAKGSRKSKRPEFVTHWRDILQTEFARYPDTQENQGLDALFGRRARFSRIGVHAESIGPGRRTSYPHAERDEEEWVYVISGTIECWLDGYLHRMEQGDFVGFEARTGITHVCINNSDEEAVLLVGGEASRARNQCWYPYHPSRNDAFRKEGIYWADHPVPKLGPHDGLPDSLRARIPARSRSSALAANTAVLKLPPDRVP